MRRIIVLGCPGSGKSRFAEKLSRMTGLPLYHLDNLWWKPDRTHVSREAFDDALDELLAEDAWILDGDYSRTYEKRIAACDTVFFLDLPEEDCLRGIAERIGRARSDLPWTEDGPDPEFAERVRRYGREKRPALLKLFEQYPDKKVIVFHTREETDRWLLEAAGGKPVPGPDEC